MNMQPPMNSEHDRITTRGFAAGRGEIHRYSWPTVHELTAPELEQQRRLVRQSLLQPTERPLRDR